MRVRYSLIVSALLFGCACQLGCSMCANPFDDYYTAYGGVKQRVDMTGGRVGSAFHNAEFVAQGDATYDGGAVGEYGEGYQESGSPEYYDDQPIYDEQRPYDVGEFGEGYDPFDAGSEHGFYDRSGIGEPIDRPLDELPPPEDLPTDAMGAPLNLGQPGPTLSEDLDIPQVPGLDEAGAPEPLPLP